jgi:hypothetical protein
MCNCGSNISGNLCCHEEQAKEMLGLVATSYREIKSGSQYESYFPKSDVAEKITIEDGTVRDTVKEIEKIVAKYNWQTKAIAQTLKRNTLPETLNAIWDFFYNHYQYKLDRPEVEELRTPARAWHDRKTGIDCDCYSISISSVLTNLGIKHKFRVTKYGAGWQHIYVIVPVPNSIKSEYWVLDCVLDRFNYEKTYTDKFDYKMETLGIPIAVLSGLDNDSELHSILSGVDFDQPGFGATSTLNDDLGALHRHLTRTYAYIRRNPHSVIFQGGARNNCKMLEHALKNWHCPHRREQALNGLAEAEHELNVSMGLAGADDYNPDADDDHLDDVEDSKYDEINGLGKVKGKRRFWNAVKNAHKKIVAFHKKVGKKIWEGHKKLFKGLLRFNPLTMAVRGAILLVLRTNMFQMARALYPAYVPESESKRFGYTDEQIRKAKTAKGDIERIFIKILQGKESAISKNIIHGATHNRRALYGIAGIDGGDDNLGSAVAAGASLVAASAPLIKIAKVLNKVGLKDGKGVSFVQKIIAFFKKRKAKKQAEGDTTEAGATDSVIAANSAPSPESTPENGSESNNARKSGNGSSAAEGSDNSEEKTSVSNLPNKPGTETDATDSGEENKPGNNAVTRTANTTPTTTTTDTGTDEEGFFAKAKNWVKDNPGKTAAIAVTGAAVIAFAVSPKLRSSVANMFGGKKKPSLSGVKRRKKVATKHHKTSHKHKKPTHYKLK